MQLIIEFLNGNTSSSKTKLIYNNDTDFRVEIMSINSDFVYTINQSDFKKFSEAIVDLKESTSVIGKKDLANARIFRINNSSFSFGIEIMDFCGKFHSFELLYFPLIGDVNYGISGFFNKRDHIEIAKILEVSNILKVSNVTILSKLRQ